MRTTFIGRPNPAERKVEAIQTRLMQLLTKRRACVTGYHRKEIAVGCFAGSRANAHVCGNAGHHH